MIKNSKKVRRFDVGGPTDAMLSEEQIKFLGKADRTDPFIMARMEAAHPYKARDTPAPVEERGITPTAPTAPTPVNAEPSGDNALDIPQEGRFRLNEESGGINDYEGDTSKPTTKATPKATPAKTSTSTPLSKSGYGINSGRSADDSRRLDRQPSGRSADDSRRLDRQPDKKGSGRSADDPRRLDRQPESMAKTNAGAVTGRVASRESKHMPSDELKEERGDRGAEMIGMGASMLPVGRVASGLLALKNAAGAAKATTAVGQYIPRRTLNTVYDTGRSLSGPNPRRLAAPPRRLAAPPRRLEPPELKKGGTVDTKKPNPFMEMIAKKKAMAKDKKPEMKFAKGGMARGGMPMKDGKPAFMKKMNMGGMAKYAKGGGIESHGKTKGTIIRMASGGSVSSASRRADGIAQRGKTRC